MTLASTVRLLALTCVLRISAGDSRGCSYCGKSVTLRPRLSPTDSRTGAQSLTVEPDYRALKLSWKYVQAQEPPAFRVKYCEVSDALLRREY